MPITINEVVIQGQASSDVLLVVDGMTGESSDDSVDGALALKSWSFGLARDALTAPYGGGAGGGARVTEVIVTFGLEQMAIELTSHCSNNTSGRDAKLIQRRPGGATPAEVVMEIELEDIMIASIDYNCDGTGLPICTMSIKFKRISVSYFPQRTGTGQAQGAYNWVFDAEASD